MELEITEFKFVARADAELCMHRERAPTRLQLFVDVGTLDINSLLINHSLNRLALRVLNLQGLVASSITRVKRCKFYHASYIK